MKTEPYQHQQRGLEKLTLHRRHYAIGCEQGTGKTWMLLADVERQFASGRITGALVIAPKGVHTNWVRREIPKHMDVDCLAARYLSDGRKADMDAVRRVVHNRASSRLHILAMNVDAINTKNGYAVAELFLREHRAVMIIDESHIIKSMTSQRTKKAIELGKLAVSRRISSGTMLDTPPDLFAQFEFLKPGGGLLGTRSFHAFKATYAEILPENHPLVRNIVEKNPRMRGKPQIIARDELGRPIWKNIERLQSILDANSYRVLKEQCVDLPPKVYEVVPFRLTPKQRKLYDQVNKESLLEMKSGEVQKLNPLSKLTKLRQVTSGFVKLTEEDRVEPLDLEEASPRLEALKEVIASIGTQQFVIWAVYQEEVRLISNLLKELNIAHGLYYGPSSNEEREAALDNFHRGNIQCFVATQSTGAEGIELTGAKIAVFYSSLWSLIKRKQAEDRNHRIGSTGNKVTYIDIVAEDTVDEKVAAALQHKSDVAAAVLGDRVPGVASAF